MGGLLCPSKVWMLDLNSFRVDWARIDKGSLFHLRVASGMKDLWKLEVRLCGSVNAVEFLRFLSV